jgi:selenocysteine lyase/cysteine desulfurase
MSIQALKVRSLIPALSKMTYLDSAGAGLPPTPVTDAMKRHIDDWSSTGEHWEEWLLEVVECRRLFGKLIGAGREEVAVVPSVSVGLAALASAVDLSKRRKVVVSSLNFPTNVILWQRMREEGLIREVRVLQHQNGAVALEDYERAIDDNTAIVAVDYVSWLSGVRENIKEISKIAHSHGALLVVDAFHALNVFTFNAKADGIDALVAGFYKWLCGPHGAACLYVSREKLSDLEPAYIGWHGIRDNVIERLQAKRDVFDVPFPLDKASPSASNSRFEWGTWASVVVKGAIESMKFSLKTDLPSHFRTIKKHRERLESGLAGLGFKMLTPPVEKNPGSGILTFRIKDHASLVSNLSERRVIVSGRFGYVRVSPHFYNNSDDVDNFLDGVRQWKKS